MKETWDSMNIENESSPARLHTGKVMVERAIQISKSLIAAKLKVWIRFSENVNEGIRERRFTIHPGLKVTPFELNHRRKWRTELTNIVKDNKNLLSVWSNTNRSVKPKLFLFYVRRSEKYEMTDHIFMTKKRNRPCCSTLKSSKRIPVKSVKLKMDNLHKF